MTARTAMVWMVRSGWNLSVPCSIFRPTREYCRTETPMPIHRTSSRREREDRADGDSREGAQQPADHRASAIYPGNDGRPGGGYSGCGRSRIFHGDRPGTWGASTARGAMVGITAGDTVSVRVLREDLDDGAPLFVKSSNTSLVSIQSPAGGGPLGADGIFQIRGVSDVKNTPVKIEVRLGA